MIIIMSQDLNKKQHCFIYRKMFRLEMMTMGENKDTKKKAIFSYPNNVMTKQLFKFFLLN